MEIRGEEKSDIFLHSVPPSYCWIFVLYTTYLTKLPSEVGFETNYHKMLYCSFHRRSRRQPLSHFHQQLRSEEVSGPHSLASSVKTLLEQHPVSKEPEIPWWIKLGISINWANFLANNLHSLSAWVINVKKVCSLNLKFFFHV